MRLPIQHIECFHLVLLRMMESRVDRSGWIVKGGVNLRLWFESHLCSEDLVVDAIKGSPHGLADRMDKLLSARTFRDMLESQGLRLTRCSKPKQTATTQRWKFEIQAEGVEVPLHTRVEFSRRGSAEAHALEPARSDVVRPYGLLAPTVNHYTARSAVRQKIAALAARAEPQARDVWGLEHLLRTTGVDPGPFAPAERRALAVALDRATGLSFEVYRSQVVPYLPPEQQELCGAADAWDRMRELVVDRLAGHLE